MGSALGVAKTAAARTGLSLDDYQRRVASGLKWCTAHKDWHPVGDFPRDRTRGDGRKARCLASEHGKPRAERNPLHERARKAVAYAVRTGELPNPNRLLCLDCGHLGADRRHEYDHHNGYEPDHHLDVEPVCTTCHADREVRRRVR